MGRSQLCFLGGREQLLLEMLQQYKLSDQQEAEKDVKFDKGTSHTESALSTRKL